MRNGTEINYSIARMRVQSQGNVYMNVGGSEIKNCISFKKMVQHNIQQQIREDQITCCIDKQTELPQTLDQRSVFISSEAGQGEDTNVINEING
ncbi:MAG: hypothetical protein EZS28_012146 [Streblomastix strix]|uniref:Uncharacterized protein n=1 Tax=Streblomastix strix TaxID=222440 RepID=A0A5J4WCP3_9EUKA|nr:MAG: hypothetical protein EZS28_012146 [Streblomastix strix]